MSRIVLLVLLAVGASVCESKKLRASSVRLGPNPAAVIRFQKTAIDGLFSSIGDAGCKYAHKIPIPDVQATVSGVDLNTYSVRMTKFMKPRFNYRFVPPNKIEGQISLPHVGIQGGFNASRRVIVTTQRDSGVLIFNASDANVSFSTSFGEFENGIPKVGGFECEAKLGPANLNIREAKQKFAVDLLNVFAKGVRPTYNKQVCAVCQNMIDKQINRLLGKMPNVIEPNDKISIKFAVKPVVKSDSIEIQLFAKTITETVSQYNPAPLQEVSDEQTHVVILVSDAPINDALYQGYKNGLFEITVNNNSQPILYNLVSLKPSADETPNLGTAVPSLGEKYGQEANVEFVVKATKAPVVAFTKDKASFTGAITVDLYITPAKTGVKQHETSASVDLTGTFRVKIQNGVAYAKIDITDLKAHVANEQDQKWDEKIESTIKQVVEEHINGDVLLKGVNLNLPFGLGLTAPSVTFQPNTLQIQTGFSFVAKTSSEEQ